MNRRLCALLTTLIAACTAVESDPPNPPTVDFDRRALLENIGSNVVIPVYERFQNESNQLAASLATYCSTIGTADEEVRRTAAREAWHTAMDTWQLAELMLFGSAASDGQALRDLIYSWPIVSACAVEQDVMLAYDDPGGYDITQRLTNRRGLDALELLLFGRDDVSVCPPQARPAGWDALSATDKRAARCAFANIAADDLRAQADELLEAWMPGAGDFAGELASAGESGTRFESIDDAVDDVFGAMFYIDVKTKDWKIGKPAGLLPGSCDAQQTPCIDDLESKHAHRSKENVAANVAALGMLFSGDGLYNTDGLGFDDYLRAAGAEDVAAAFAAEVARAQTMIEAVPGSLADALETHYEMVVGTHEELRAVTHRLKTDAPELLGLKIPSEAAGDAD